MLMMTVSETMMLLSVLKEYNDYLYNDYMYNDYLYSDYMYNNYMYNDQWSLMERQIRNRSTKLD